MLEMTLFNLNDLIVMMTGLLSLLLACLLVLRHQGSRIQQRFWLFLAGFFLLNTMQALDTLFYWNIPISTALSAISTGFFFVLGFGLLLQGPLLYGFTKAAIYRDFSLRWHAALHLLPALLYPVYVYAIYHRFDTEYQLQFVHDWSNVTGNIYFDGLIWAQRLSVFIYSALCVYQLHHYMNHLRSTHFLLNKVDIHWLTLLLIGFFTVNTWVVITLLESRFTDWGFDSLMGMLESYFRFILVSTLIVYLVRNSKGFTDIQLEHTLAEAGVTIEQHAHAHLLEKLQNFMATEKPYLELNISVERLAVRLQVSPKLLSSTINNQLHRNFFEMISGYRIDEAKRCLADPTLRDLSISEVMKMCGFNSKSVFNQAFKKALGVTPSHYRQQHLGISAR